MNRSDDEDLYDRLVLLDQNNNLTWPVGITDFVLLRNVPHKIDNLETRR
jgi:hypothetical protein